MTRETFILTIRSEPSKPGDAPEIHRLKRLLKAMLRTFGFRCLRIEPLQAFDPTKAENDPASATETHDAPIPRAFGTFDDSEVSAL